MKLLLATRDFPAASGDAAHWWLELAYRLASRSADFAVWCWGTTPALRAAPFEVIPFGSARGAADVWRCGRFDAVLAADWASAAPLLAWRARSTRVFAAAFGPELAAAVTRRPLAALQRHACSAVLSRCDGVLAVSPAARTLLSGWGVRSTPVPMGVDGERFQPSARGVLAQKLGLVGRRVLVGVGPLVAQRHAERVMYAVSALGIRYPDLRYVLAGDGPERPALELLAERLRIAHRVRFLGEIERASRAAVYNLADIVVQLGGDAAALTDASGSVPLEALACGKPVVVAHTASLAGLVDESVGRLVPEGDGRALTEVLCELLDRPALARELGARGRQRVLAQASWEQVAERCCSALEPGAPVAARPPGRVRRALDRPEQTRDAAARREPRISPAAWATR